MLRIASISQMTRTKFKESDVELKQIIVSARELSHLLSRTAKVCNLYVYHPQIKNGLDPWTCPLYLSALVSSSSA